MRPILLLCFLYFSLLHNLSAQVPDSARKQVDSFRNAALDQQSAELQRLKNAHLADSVREQQLQVQLRALQSTNNLKKEGLVKELAALRWADSLRLTRQRRQVDSLRSIVKGFPVKPFLDTLFLIYSKQGSFTAGERADAVVSRIRKLHDDYQFSPDSLQIIPSENTTDVVYKGDLIIAVSEQDGLWMNESREQLAQQYKAA